MIRVFLAWVQGVSRPSHFKTLPQTSPQTSQGLSATVLVLAALTLGSSPAGANEGAPVPIPRPADLTPRTLTSDDALAARRILNTARRRGWARALESLDTLKDRTAVSVVLWLSYQDAPPKGSFEAVTDFLRSHPEWPLRERIRARAEKLIPPELPAQDVLAWFGDREPATADGMLRLGEAHLVEGKASDATVWLRRAWRGSDLSRDGEKELRERHIARLRDVDHEARIEALLWSRQTTRARAVLDLLPLPSRRLAEARMAFQGRAPSPQRRLEPLPKTLQKDPGLLYDQIVWHRRVDRHNEAWPLLLAGPEKGSAMVRPDLWWRERRIQAWQALRAAKPEIAYQFASTHSLTRGTAFADAEWLSGWIALRFLQDPAKAEAHFARLSTNVSRPISVARAEYWLGRALEAQNRDDIAAGHFEAAATHAITFYGQLAAAKLGGSQTTLSLSPVAPLDASIHRTLQGRELTRAAAVAADFAPSDRVRILLDAAVNGVRNFEPTTDTALLRHAGRLAWDWGLPHVAIQLRKEAVFGGHPADASLYPVVMMPPYAGRGVEPETAHVLALIRQESEFNVHARSRAGAIGLMQIKPATATETAARHRLAHKSAWLTARPGHNTQLGRAYLADLLDRFDGSVVLATAAYNAGPNQVSEWLDTFGAPGPAGAEPDAGGDRLHPIDWIETIPFRETRNYVQRVLESVSVYRHRLADAPVRLDLDSLLDGPVRRAGQPTDAPAPTGTL